VLLLIYVYIWVRATLPRVRYDRLMAFGWKLLIPWGLVWVLLTGAVVVLPDVYGKGAIVTAGIVAVGAALAISLIWPLFTRSTSSEEATS
jgi:NADH-quinone oxidoreductase subunit H